MIKQIKIFYAITFFCFFGGLLNAQNISQTLYNLPQDTIFVHSDSLKKPFKLPAIFIIPSSEKLQLRSFKLQANLHYQINYQKGIVKLLKEMPSVDSLRITFKKLPLPLVDNYYHRELVPFVPKDSLDNTDSLTVASAKNAFFLESIDSYENNLQKSGSIVRGIEIGNNQDLTLNSGLNLQLSGNISEDVKIIAALTDESTPIQPEGNTQTLREVDKVFVKIESPFVGGTLGDFNIQYQNSAFGNLQRKLQGVTIENDIKKTHQQVTFGTSRGQFFTNKFLAQEGNQGPYLLVGKNGEREIIVLAGTEKVFVDGELKIRGENNDYIIDYGLAQITFTSKQLITSENRIEVDFEFTNLFQRYGRNFLGVTSHRQNRSSRIEYDVRAFREWDDTKNLLEDNSALSDEETTALSLAGDDPFKASISGVSLNPLGTGSYAVADTLINDSTITFYKHVGDSGDYSVRFSGVGSLNGDYIRERFGVFQYVGPKNGNYLPIRLVPLAGDKQFIDVGIGLKISKNWLIKSEFSVSRHDQNVFSDIDDQDNQGTALRIVSALADTAFRILGKKIGKVNFNTKWQQQEARFSPLDRPLQPEYAYKWNLNATDLTAEESNLEATGSFQPNKYIRFSGSYGSIEKGDIIASTRRQGKVETFKNILPDISLNAEAVDSRSLLDKSKWFRQQYGASKRIKGFTPKIQYKLEDRKVTRLDDGRVTGFAFNDLQTQLAIRKLGGIEWFLQQQLRNDFLYDPNNANNQIAQANTQTVTLKGDIKSEKRLKGQFSFVYREKDYDAFFEELPADSLVIYQVDAQFQDTTWQDRQSHLANINLQYKNKAGTINARWDYKIASELQALREKRYVAIEGNRGNFRFDSTLAEYVPDPQGDFILILLPTGDFQSVIRMESAVQLQYRPKSIKGRKKIGFWRSFYNQTSTNTYLKVEEQSKKANIWDIYLLKLSEFHNVASSLRGVYIINQDINYNERNPDWGVLIRSRYRDNLSNQFLTADNNETRIVWDRLIQGRRRFFRRKLNLIGEYKDGINKRQVAASQSRNLDIKNQTIITKLNFRPSVRWQFKLDAERAFQTDRNASNPLAVDYWELKPQMAFALRGKARTTLNITYLDVQLGKNPNNRAIPFEMGKGKKAGTSWLWNFRFEYFINNNITINLNYNGRKDAEAFRTLHLGKAEVRAFL